ncbi:ParB/RepB/Spo0J family partition protein [Loktanella sp. IMCC34160]|uniref:ParB/RepB/Spo0J family partition protein n=1 Tax=Loktanella sp. IMCC34160 TaxID=2510646 RepID=UPI0013EB96F6|nr:ParB/RepB/Spo0J family partition protein [Loktanella sp. IMCC34160]
MNHQAITSTLDEVPFADLFLSPLNPRTVVLDAEIETLAANIKEYGLIQNLAGLREEDGKVGIVAGGRRFRALALLQDDPRFQTVTVRIAPDEETARTWAASENHLREQPHPADEIREFGVMAQAGANVAAIGIAFGVSEAHVYRRLKLADLPAPVLDALKSNDISLNAAAAFTISTDAKLTLEVLEAIRGQSYSENRIKQMLKPDAIRDSDRRAVFVGKDAYEAAGGTLTTDLFADTTFFDDLALLEDLFAAKLSDVADAMKAAGWRWAETFPSAYVGWHEIDGRKIDRIYPVKGVLSEDEAERYDDLSERDDEDGLNEAEAAELAALQDFLDGDWSDDQKAVAGVFVYVDQSGDLRTSEGLVLPEDRVEAIASGVLRGRAEAGGAAPKSPISQKLRDDLDRVARGARHHAILRDPDILLDLLAYQLSHNLNWQNPLGISTTEVPNWPSTEAEGYNLDPRLSTEPPRDMHGKDLAKSFRAFRSKGADHSRGELTRFLAAHYRGGDEKLSAMIAKEVQPDVREVWTPTAANFFSRVSGPYLVDLWRDLLELAEDHPTVTTFAKLKKADKAAKLEALFSDADTRSALGLTEAQVARIDGWLPEGMS